MEDVATRFRELDATREPLYWYLNMRRAGTMGGPFLLRRLSGAGGEPGPLVFVGEASYFALKNPPRKSPAWARISALAALLHVPAHDPAEVAHASTSGQSGGPV